MSCSVLRAITLIAVLGFTGAFQGLAAAQNVTDPGQIVEKVVQAYGGRAALERVKVVKHTGTIQSHRLGKTGSLERLFALPGRLRVDLNYPGGPRELRITTPEGAWRDGKPATAPMHKAMELQAARFRLPLILTESPVTLLGEDEGRLRLSVKLTPSTALEVFVDPGSWRIVRSVGYMTMGGMSMAFTTDYSDFRPVDGVLFAHREELAAMGMPTGVAILERIELNGETGPEDFKP